MNLSQKANFAQLFEEAALRSPDHLAVVDGDRRWTYAEMLEDVLGTARWLREEQGVLPDENVCVRMDNSYELLVSCLAINYIGACWMPLSFEIPRIEPMLADAGVRVVMTGLPPERRVSESVRAFNRAHVTRDHRLFLVYSSGSTGTPKGIVQTQRAFLRGVQWRFTRVPNGPQTRMGAYIFFIWEAFRPLFCGGTVHVIPKLTLLDGHRLVALLNGERITEIQFTPSAVKILVEHLERHPSPLPHLEVVWLCGEVVHGDLAQRMSRVFSSQTRLLNLYSISEAPDLAIGDLREHQAQPVQPLTDFIDGFSHRLTAEGELVVSAPTVSTVGYLGRDDLNATRFDLSTEPASYHTGDRVGMVDGALVVYGRCDFMKKVRGYSVQIDELEHEIQRLVGASNVLVHFDEATSELSAFVQKPSVTERTEIFRLLRASLPSYAVPTRISVVQEEIGALDPVSGKRERKRLAHTFGALGDLWESVLKRAPGPNDDFFVVGGDSLAAVTLLGHINDHFGLTLRIDDFYEHSNIIDLHALVHGQDVGEVDEMGRDVEALVAAHRDTRFERGAFRAVVDAERVLVTGASGYLGTWLVHALTHDHGKEVTCLVRNPAQWRERVEGLYRTSLPWERVRCIVGDMEAERFGLDEETFEGYRGHFDAIVHCASLVNFTVSYARLQRTNLRGLETLLHWATRASFHMISSNAIYPAGYGECRESMLDELATAVNSPYGRSKWVLEKALRTLEVPAAFYRLGNIGPHRSGAYNRNDAQMLLIEACDKLDIGVDAEQHALEFSPLEHVVEVVLTQDKPEVVNVVNARRMPLREVRFSQMLPLAQWMEAASAEHPVLVRMLSDVDHWLEDSNRYETRFGAFDYAPRLEALRRFVREVRAPTPR